MTKRTGCLVFLFLLLAVRLCAQVAPGMSESDLLALKGPPLGKMSIGGRAVYKWPDMQVVVDNGVVTRITEAQGTPAAPSRVPEAVPREAGQNVRPPEYEPRPQAPNAANFQTHWQDESQYIVENVSADLIEMYIYARMGKLARVGGPGVAATEINERAYLVEARVESYPVFRATLPIRHTIFSADTYQPLLDALAVEFGSLKRAEGIEVEGLVDTLTEPRAEVIEIANQNVSAELENEFSAPVGHEQAALVLAAFALREHSGKFYQILSELCRMSAHLAFSKALRGDTQPSVDGRVAEAAMLCLLRNEADSQKLVRDLPETEPGVAAWRRGLTLQNTCDIRSFERPATPSLFEEFEYFNLLLSQKGEGDAWSEVGRLEESRRRLPDWGRMACVQGYSVGVGHRLLATMLPADFAEIKSVFELSSGAKLAKGALVASLNTPPSHCLTSDNAGVVHVNVIGWGTWAAFLQRHLCQTIESDYNFLARLWGVPDRARDFLKEADLDFWGLELYPFVRRLNAMRESYYRAAQDDEMALVRRAPQVVPATVWNYVSYSVPEWPKYVPPPHPFINEWHKHNPPQGTAYNIYPRLDHPSLMNRPDTQARLEELHSIAPWDLSISRALLKVKFGDHPSGEQVLEAYQAISDYSPWACATIAHAFAGEPAEFERWMTRAASLSPVYYYQLADFLKEHGRDDDAAAAYENAFAGSSDPVAVANSSEWLVKYYESHGQPDSATRLADKAAEVYSFAGLQAKATLLEMRRDYDGALDLYHAIYERYNNPVPMLRFLVRVQKEAPGDKFAAQLKNVSEQLITGGLKTVDSSELTDAPRDGMLISVENPATKEAGLQLGDVVVAVYGYRVRDFHSYTVLRELADGPMALTLWRSTAYLRISASPPHKRFGINFTDYRGN